MDKHILPFTITNDMLLLVSSVSEKVGRTDSHHGLQSKPYLKRSNRIRSIHSSLKIEANSLSQSQVKDVINGRIVLGNQKKIQEVKNVFRAYDRLSEVNPCSLSDLQMLHGIMYFSNRS